MRMMLWSEVGASLRVQVARLLLEGFDQGPSTGWPTLEAAEFELARFDGAARCGFVGVAADRAVGFVGAIKESPHMWELHPLVVDRAHRGKGYGAALTARIEEEARAQGVTTLYLGTDDDNGNTTAAGVDLYDDLPGAIARLAAVTPHPLTFYRRMGYTVVGLLPDASGPGKPDILMAKRLEGALDSK